MQKMHRTIRYLILRIIDAFYPPFKQVITMQTFRYAACGGGNMLLDIFLYTIFYNFVLQKENTFLGFVTISPYILSFIMAFCITFPIGFYLSRYVVWQETKTSKRIQIFRYFMVVLACIILKYVLLKFFIESLALWPSIANILTTVFVVTFSYFTQRYFSFRNNKSIK